MADVDAVLATGPLFDWLNGRKADFPFRALSIIQSGETGIAVSAASLYGLGLVAAQNGTNLNLKEVENLIVAKGFEIIPATAGIMADAVSLATDKKDPLFRIIAATANELGAAVISADMTFDGVVKKGRLWS